jgi:hypothetical protein
MLWPGFDTLDIVCASGKKTTPSSTTQESGCVCIAQHCGVPELQHQSRQPVSPSPVVLDILLMWPVIRDLFLDGFDTLDCLDLDFVHEFQSIRRLIRHSSLMRRCHRLVILRKLNLMLLKRSARGD